MSVQTVKHKPYLVGLTGGIASGKSTAASIFKEEGVPVIDSDLIVHDLWKNDFSMVSNIEEAFGYPMNDEGKKKLASDIFSDESKRKKLNAIIHPRVFQQIEVIKKSFDHERVIVIDMPLLIEVGYQPYVDMILLIYVDYETQLKRLIERDHLSIHDANLRIQSQMLLDKKKGYANRVIDNTLDIQSLRKAIQSFLKQVEHEKQ